MGDCMLKDIRVCTISKYPPYMSGHSFEALYQGKALLEITGEKHYEVTYDQSLYDKATNYNNSPELMSEAEQYLYVYRMLPDDKENVKVLYAPFNNTYFLERDEEQLHSFKKKFKIPENIKIISYFGRLFPEKGVEDLLAAFVIMKKYHPDTVLVIGGQGISLDDLKQHVQAQNIPDVIFTGTVSNSEKRALMQLSYVGGIPT